MDIRIDFDEYGNLQRASTWLLGRWHTTLGSSEAEAERKLIDKLLTASRTQGFKTGQMRSKVVQI